ncbi:MAG: flavodoxin family protein [Candidatus Hodarchaeota archaeon]
MRIVALVCSARERGNCYDLAEFIIRKVRAKGAETEIINAYDYKIIPCSHCNYECFKTPKACPICDDVPEIWMKLKAADGVILAIPIYYGMPSALFKALIERAQGILDWVTVEFRDLRSVWDRKVVVVLIVSNGGGRDILRLVTQQLPNAQIVEALFSYRDYGTPGYKGDLIKLSSVQRRLQELAKRMYAYLKPI